MGGDIRFHCSWWLSHHLAYPLGRQRPVIHVFSMCSMAQDKTVPMLNLAHYDMFPYLWCSVVAFTLSWHSSSPSSNWHPLPQICQYSWQLKKMVPFLFFSACKEYSPRLAVSRIENRQQSCQDSFRCTFIIITNYSSWRDEMIIVITSNISDPWLWLIDDRDDDEHNITINSWIVR